MLGGNAKVTGDFYQPSDRRVKKNFVTADSGAHLEAVSKVGLYNYDFIDSWKRMANLDDHVSH